MNDKETNKPSAEQLLKMLDLQMEASRQRRAAQDSSSNHTLRIVALVIVCLMIGGAFWVLLMMLEDLRPQKRIDAPQPQQTGITPE